jgi:hypothetical protein
MEFRPAIFVVFDEQDGLADDCHDCVLVFLRQAVQQSWRNALEQDHLAGTRFTLLSAHISRLSRRPLPS